MTNARWALIGFCAWGVLGAGCGAGDEADDLGSVGVSVGVSAVTVPIDDVSVTVTGEGITYPIATSLVLTDGHWQGTLAKIPAGSARRVTADARHDGEVVYSGSLANVTIAPGPASMLHIVLQPRTTPDPF